MPAAHDQEVAKALHPLHAALLAGVAPLLVCALLSDCAYATTQETQWANFASWLLVGGLVLAGVVVLWALIDLLRKRHRTRSRILYTVIVLAMVALGFLSALEHAKDGWGAMPQGLILSAIAALLAIVATWIGFSALRTGGAR
ncbi:membrane protein [Polymorphobacter glacialis]|uniref:Membrane protein n=1 Tax=Sandarakinorhabdus glacialis TaxID=1614636 RepID=A0A917A3I8_9SPHN|nr:DUF2231 domain-containing protein [Polymorphobacter glacialis]GGE22238.1 membrane protein [Polymorphobacter glacialis]